MHNKGCEAMPTTEAEKKAMKKYRAKRKKIACDVSNDMYDNIKLYAIKKGFTSINSYVLDLIKKDMNI